MTQALLNELWAIVQRMKTRRIHKRLLELVEMLIDFVVELSEENEKLLAENKALKGEDDGE